MQTAGIILAAGLSTRMKSEKQKALHIIAGRPLIFYPIQTALEAGCDPIVVVVGYQSDAVQSVIRQWFSGKNIRFVVQEKQLGTAHATLCAKEMVFDIPSVVVINGDLPLLTKETLKGLVTTFYDSKFSFMITGAVFPDPEGFGRIIVDEQGMPSDIIEEKDATPEQRRIKQGNVGIYASETKTLFDLLSDVDANNVKGEYYFTDVVRILRSRNGKVGVYWIADYTECMQVNDRIGLANAERIIHTRKIRALMESGVTIHQPETIMIDIDCEVGVESEIFPCVELHNQTKIGERCVIGRGCILSGVKTGDDVVLKPYSVVTDAILEDCCQVGPFAHIRPGTIIKRDAKVGNFVEMKKTILGIGSKANHLTYLGDCTVGKDVNVGAGTITCNYDGQYKHQTIIEDGAFIGSDTQLVAPVKIGQNAYVGAGTTVTKDIPPGALALSRVPQTHIMGYAERKKKK